MNEEYVLRVKQLRDLESKMRSESYENFELSFTDIDALRVNDLVELSNKNYYEFILNSDSKKIKFFTKEYELEYEQ